ncbi:MAG: helix-turn-helix domain-containing protein [Ruminococcus sp.]|nr:helix-turn-helix domain-containing protein [Ruminococcus sp.]
MFEERIKELRISLGLNQIQFGNKLFVSKQCVSNWENGNIQPSIDMVIKISKTFSVSADYILGLSNKRTLNVSGLTNEQILHIQNVVNDIKALQNNNTCEPY